MKIDDSINIKTQIDNSEVDKDLKTLDGKLAKSIKKISDKINSIGNKDSVKALGNIGNAFNGLKGAAGIAIQAVQKVGAVMADLNNAYKAQQSAEVSLETAARNNPYLDARSVENLKDFASELQGIGTIGDEQLLPMMAQLAAAGRTQEEIQGIMAAALDVSASGAMSMDSAVRNLNKTFSGLSGELGESVPQIKELTQEELKQGKAIEVLAEQYKGMAKETANATGSAEQLKNTWGDFKEVIGSGINAIITPLEKSVNNILSKINEAAGKAKEIKDKGIAEAQDIGIDTDNGVDARIRAAKAEAEELKAIEKQKKEDRRAYEATLTEIAKSEANKRLKVYQEEQGWTDKKLKSWQKGVVRTYNRNHSILNDWGEIYRDVIIAEGAITVNQNNLKDIYEQSEAIYEVKKKENEETLKKLEEEKRLAEINETIRKSQEEANASAQEAYNQYDATIASKEKEIFARKQAGEEISKEQEAQELLNTKLSAYLTLMQNPNISGTVGRAKQISEEIAEEATAQKDYNSALETLGRLTEEINPQIEELLNPENTEGSGSLSEAIDLTVEALKRQMEQLEKNSEMWKKYDDTVKSLESQKGAVEEAEKSSEFSRFLGSIDGGEDELSERESLLRQKNELEEKYNDLTLESQAEFEDEYKSAEKALQNDISEIDREAAEQRKQEQLEAMGSIVSTVQQAAETVGSACDLMLEYYTNEATLEQQEAEEQYAKGELSEEEYYEKLEEIKKDAAQKEYKIELAKWAMNLASATANVAMGVVNAIAQGGVPLGIIQGALVAAAGAVQIASIVASKPQPPSFATGGIVQGSSWNGDNVRANVNSGEMILNARQQRALWEAANGNGTGQKNTNIVIQNSASNVVTAQPQIDENKIKILIDARVNESMRKGRYNNSLNAAESNKGGRYYGV